MARRATVFSRLSAGYVTSAKSLVDVDPTDTGDAFEVLGNSLLDGNTSTTGNATVTGNLTVTGTLAQGSGGASIGGMFGSDYSVNFASVAGGLSVTTPVTVTGASIDDVVLVTPSSTWSGTYGELVVSGQVTAANTVTLTCSNTSSTAIDPDALNMAILVIGV